MQIHFLTLLISIHTLYRYTQYPNNRDTKQLSEFDPNIKKLSLLDKLMMYQELLDKKKDDCDCEKRKGHTKVDNGRTNEKEEDGQSEDESYKEEEVSECNCDEDNDYLNGLEEERKKKNAVIKAKQLEDRRIVEKDLIPAIEAESAINDKLMRDAYERRLRDSERALVVV